MVSVIYIYTHTQTKPLPYTLLCYVLPHLTLFVPRQYIKPSLWFCAYGAEDVFELSNPCDQELTLDGLDEIQKQSTLEVTDEPESKLK
jgi:hypothetical protein